jgi:ATP-binding cassette, subfamily B, bacterial PglK
VSRMDQRQNSALKTSFFSEVIEILDLLSYKHRVGAIGNIVFSIGIALLEVFSLTVILPLFYYLLDQGKSWQVPQVMQRAILSMESVSWIVVVTAVILIFALKNILSVWQTHKQLKFLNLLYLDFSRRIYNRFYLLNWNDYAQTNSAETFRKIKDTPFEFINYVLNSCFLLITDVIICLMMVGVIAWFDYRILFILIILCIPVFIFYFFFKRNVILKTDRSFRELTPVTNVILTQGISSYTEARIYQKQNYFIDKFIDVSRVTTTQLINLKTFTSLPTRILETIGVVLFASMIVYARTVNVDAQNIVVFIGLISLALYRIMPSFNRILQSLSQIQSYAYTVSTLKENLNHSEEETSAKQTAINFDGGIELRSLSFQYTDKTRSLLLDHINIKISKGDFVMLQGPSGTGKTTLLNILSGVIEDYGGEIIIDNKHRLDKQSIQAWQSRLGVVSQSPIILQDTILHNIAFGEQHDEIDRSKVKVAIALAGINDFIEMLTAGIDTPIGENGITLSGGQRQRLCLARALYREPDILLLDEVTNQLDENNKVYILERLQSLCRMGKTVILASHDPVVKQYASHILSLDNKVLTGIK